jgi:maltooligosyltrehalose trehalohydrolase
LRLAMATLILAPAVPLLFMGEEFGARTPFLFFCDFHGELATAVRDGRRMEFARFARFADPKARETIPDPNALATFEASRLRWEDLARPAHAESLARVRGLLALRAGQIVPRLAGPAHRADYEAIGVGGVAVDWTLGDGSRLHLRANFSAAPEARIERAPGAVLHSEGDPGAGPGLPAWAGVWSLEAA